MILSDGTTSVTITEANETFGPVIDKSTRRSSGGRLKSQTSGKRINFRVECRTTQTVYASLLSLLTNGADKYFYTPEETYDLFTSVSFPIEVNVTKLKRKWDNRRVVYITFEVEAVDYY